MFSIFKSGSLQMKEDEAWSQVRVTNFYFFVFYYI